MSKTPMKKLKIKGTALYPYDIIMESYHMLNTEKELNTALNNIEHRKDLVIKYPSLLNLISEISLKTDEILSQFNETYCEKCSHPEKCNGKFIDCYLLKEQD